MNKLLLAFLAASVLAWSQFHPVSEGATKVVPGWGGVIDHTTAANQTKYANRVAFLRVNGFLGTQDIILVARAPIPAFPPPPDIPMILFRCADLALNPEVSLHDYALFLKTPGVTLAELKSHCSFGDPKTFIDYADPKAIDPVLGPGAAQPVNPVGDEMWTGANKFYVVPGDNTAAGETVTVNGKMYRKVVRQWLFGTQSWWEGQKNP